MSKTVRSPYSSAQMAVWLRGLLTIAWADGQFDENERRLIVTLMESEQGLECEPIAAAELAAGLGQDPEIGENFLRTAVMVAIADGTYSASEAIVIRQFSNALGLAPALLDSLNLVVVSAAVAQPALVIAGERSAEAALATSQPPETYLAPLRSVQDWLDQVDIHDSRLARFLCRMIPAQCPFERDVSLFGRTIAHIPPLCKLNPLYEQLVGLRFRALSYLADACHEDVSPYC